MSKQLKQFNLAKMGKEKGMCLKNVRIAFGIGKKFPSAKADMENNRNKGLLHDISTLPTDVAVPVYLDTSSKYEHIMVADHGVYYSDGARLTSTAGLKFFGWGETVNDERIIEYIPTPQPTPTAGFLPARGWWTKGDIDTRVGQLATFMRNTFPAYTNAKALGNLYGPYLISAIKEFQKRTGLEADGNTGPKTYAKLKEFGFKG